MGKFRRWVGVSDVTTVLAYTLTIIQCPKFSLDSIERDL